MHTAVKHFASTDFWSLYRHLPADVRETADKYFALLKSDPRHPSLLPFRVFRGYLPLTAYFHSAASSPSSRKVRHLADPPDLTNSPSGVAMGV